MPHETLMMLRVPDLAGVANREIRRDLRARLGLVKGAKDATPSATTTAATSPTSAAATAGGEGGRGERETSDQQSTAERRNQTAALLVIELKKSAHREILPIEIRSR